VELLAKEIKKSSYFSMLEAFAIKGLSEKKGPIYPVLGGWGSRWDSGDI
jgi:hypothetical protein